MMDREASLAAVQIDFLDNVCADVFGSLARLGGAELAGLAEGAAANRERWQRAQQESADKRSLARNL